jgi:hypothetical protein
MPLMESPLRYISQQMRNAHHVPVLARALVQHRKHVQHVVAEVLLQTTKECFRFRSRAVHAVATASLSKTPVPRVAVLA